MNWLQLLQRAQFHGSARIASSRDRYLWLFSHLLFLFCSVAVIYETVTRFFRNPTYLVRLASVDPVRGFPTVVLCPQIMFLDHKINYFLSKVIYPPNTNITYIKKILPQLGALYSHKVLYRVENLEKIIELLEYNKMDIENAALALTASCDETILKCGWRGKNIDCSSLFRMELTNHGFCCIFNGRSLRSEIKEPGYFRKVMSTDGIGPSYGLNIAIEQNVSRPPVNLGLSYKWVSLKNSEYMYVDMIVNGTAVSPRLEMWTGFTIKDVELSPDASQLSVNLRRCLLAAQPLTYFKQYRREYCILECEMKRMAKQCNCNLLNHPGVLKMPICGPRQLACARSVAVRLGVDICKCPNACDFESPITTQFTFPLKPNTPIYDTFYDNLNLRRVSILRTYLNGYMKTSFSRRTRFKSLNLFGQIGGTFNVFFGCSILTVFELLFLLRRYLRERSDATIQEISPVTR